MAEKKKHYRSPSIKPRVLKVGWGRVDGFKPSLVYVHGGQGSSKPDARVLSGAFEEVIVFDGKSLAAELESRGYDLTTLKFSISLKEVA